VSLTRIKAGKKSCSEKVDRKLQYQYHQIIQQKTISDLVLDMPSVEGVNSFSTIMREENEKKKLEEGVLRESLLKKLDNDVLETRNLWKDRKSGKESSKEDLNKKRCRGRKKSGRRSEEGRCPRPRTS